MLTWQFLVNEENHQINSIPVENQIVKCLKRKLYYFTNVKTFEDPEQTSYQATTTSTV